MLIRYSGNPLVDLTRDDDGAGPSNAVKDEHADPRGKNNIVDDERVPNGDVVDDNAREHQFNMSSMFVHGDILPKPRYQEETSIARGVEEQLDMKTDVKMDVKLDMELDVKISHGRAREEREACTRGKRRRPLEPVRPAPDRDPVPPADRAPTDDESENKSAADIITWREYEALRNEMRREFRAQDDELKGTVQEISQKLDATHVTITTMQDQMTDVQRSLADLRLAIENLTVQQQQDDDDDPDLQDDAHNARGAPRGDRARGWAPLGRNGRGHDEEDGLGKPKFSIPKFEGGADVEEYLTWELKIEKLWNLHPHYTEDRKIKLASSEFDGYALRWWDTFVRNARMVRNLYAHGVP
ncbi:hypothetical protein QYE76_050703 [Lolium multiflorum]|uniref:Uncharacterized protein n=1 Tax=Lolium multiflorum TaxID=4521 RepID=A0AAD8WHJ2_LOLMU|nr:hypothetical protein QYE76_050703 [Lolium multiflorum]